MFQDKYQEPTYNTALQVVKMIQYLEESREGELEIAEIAKRLEVHPRTVKRYVDAISQEVSNSDGKPVIVRYKRGRTPFAKLNRTAKDAISITLYEYAIIRLAAHQFGQNETELGAIAGHAAQKMSTRIPDNMLEAGNSLDQAFAYIPFGPKDYEENSVVVRKALDATMHCRLCTVTYPSSDGSGDRERAVQPLCIVLYRDSLYLYAREKQGRAYVERYFALDRIKSIQIDPKKTFVRPKNFDPSKLGTTSLGIWTSAEPGKRIQIRFTKDAVRIIKERTWPGDGTVEDQADGSVVLTMKIPVTPELRSWIAGWGLHAQVLEPESLIDDMRDHFAQALENYL